VLTEGRKFKLGRRIREVYDGCGGSIRGNSSPCLFHHPGKVVRAVVYGDGFTVLRAEHNSIGSKRGLVKRTKSISKPFWDPTMGTLKQ